MDVCKLPSYHYWTERERELKVYWLVLVCSPVVLRDKEQERVCQQALFAFTVNKGFFHLSWTLSDEREENRRQVILNERYIVWHKQKKREEKDECIYIDWLLLLDWFACFGPLCCWQLRRHVTFERLLTRAWAACPEDYVEILSSVLDNLCVKPHCQGNLQAMNAAA